MKEKINELQELLLNKKIRQKTAVGPKYYNVVTITERKDRIVIETRELKTFTETLESIEILLKNIEIVGEVDFKNNSKSSFDRGDVTVHKPFVPVSQFKVSAPDITKNVSDGLATIFNELSNKNTISAEELKRAKLMCDVASKIIDCEKVKLGYLALNYR